MHISRLPCRCYRLLYPFSAHQTEMTHSPFEGRWQGEGRKTKGGRVKKKRQQIWMLLLAMAEFRRSLERRTDSNVNNKMAAFHQCLFHTGKRQSQRVMRHMPKYVLRESLSMWQKMSWGWMTDNVNATLCIFKFDFSAFLFYFYLCFLSE